MFLRKKEMIILGAVAVVIALTIAVLVYLLGNNLTGKNGNGMNEKTNQTMGGGERETAEHFTEEKVNALMSEKAGDETVDLTAEEIDAIMNEKASESDTPKLSEEEINNLMNAK